MCLRHALVVRNAPSRWIDSSFFQSAKEKSTTGFTIWMPALETSRSMRPYLAIDVGDAFLDRGLVDHVHGDGEGVAALGLDLGGGRVGGVEIEVGDHRRAALGGVAQRDFLADAAGGAGDDADLLVEASHGESFPIRRPLFAGLMLEVESEHAVGALRPLQHLGIGERARHVAVARRSSAPPSCGGRIRSPSTRPRRRARDRSSG